MALSSGLPDEFFHKVHLECRAEVGGEIVSVSLELVEAAYDDPVARKHIEGSLRQALIQKIMEKCPPKIRVRR